MIIFNLEHKDTQKPYLKNWRYGTSLRNVSTTSRKSHG